MIGQYHIPILYEDNHLLVVVKPCNMPTQADDSHDRDLLSTLKADVKQRFQKPGEVYLGLVHRLDRPAGGVMVFAKTSKAASRLSEAMRTHQWQKEYLAIVHGQLAPGRGSLRHWLNKDASSHHVTLQSLESAGAQEAWLDYEVIDNPERDLSRVRVHLHTGRKHQIRLQFATIGHPLWGDQRYGATVNHAGQQLALWSTHISVKHPTRDEIMHFRANPPKQFPWTLWL